MWNESIEAKRRWGSLNRDWLGEMIRAGAFELAALQEGVERRLNATACYELLKRGQNEINGRSYPPPVGVGVIHVRNADIGETNHAETVQPGHRLDQEPFQQR